MNTAVLKNIEEVVAIPAELVYEEINGIPVYYRGYKAVMKREKQLEEIVGYGGLQVFLLNLLADYFKATLKGYYVLVGETGLHTG